MGQLVSDNGINFIKKWEGFFPTVYKDIVGVPTIGYGMTGKEIEGLTSVTEKQATDMLKQLVNNKYAPPISQYLTRNNVNINQNQFDAVISLAYNVGVSGVINSTLMRNIVNYKLDNSTISYSFLLWCKAGGKTVEGLLNRRKSEVNLFFTPIEIKEVYEMSSIVVYNEGADQNSAEILADFLQCPTISNSRKFDFSKVKNVYAVGGNKNMYTKYLTKLITGATRFDTNQAVLDFIKGGAK